MNAIKIGRAHTLNQTVRMRDVWPFFLSGEVRNDFQLLQLRSVGKHRRTSLKDVLALKARLDAKRGAIGALADDAENLHVEHGA